MSDAKTLEEFTKKDVLEKLLDASSPHMKIENLITEHILQGSLIPGLSKKDAVVSACYGAMQAMVLMEKKLPESATNILKAAGDAATRFDVDPMEIMLWSMEGIAKVTPGLKPSDVGAIGAAIDASYQGAGQAFHDFCGHVGGA